jgi:hypothetical protein
MTNSILTKSAIVFATVLTLGSATAAFANDVDDSVSAAQATRDWQIYLNQQKAPHQFNNGRASYGFAPSDVRHDNESDRSR